MFSYREAVVYEVFDINSGALVGTYHNEASAAQIAADLNARQKDKAAESEKE